MRSPAPTGGCRHPGPADPPEADARLARPAGGAEGPLPGAAPPGPEGEAAVSPGRWAQGWLRGLARVARLAIPACLVVLVAAPPARADRIFYRAGTWLETSPAVQRLSLAAVVRGWERLAAQAEEGAFERAPTPRQREAARLTACLVGPPAYPLDAVQRGVSAFAMADPARLFYSLSDFVAAALRDLCPER